MEVLVDVKWNRQGRKTLVMLGSKCNVIACYSRSLRTAVARWETRSAVGRCSFALKFGTQPPSLVRSSNYFARRQD